MGGAVLRAVGVALPWRVALSACVLVCVCRWWLALWKETSPTARSFSWVWPAVTMRLP